MRFRPPLYRDSMMLRHGTSGADAVGSEASQAVGRPRLRDPGVQEAQVLRCAGHEGGRGGALHGSARRLSDRQSVGGGVGPCAGEVRRTRHVRGPTHAGRRRGPGIRCMGASGARGPPQGVGGPGCNGGRGPSGRGDRRQGRLRISGRLIRRIRPPGPGMGAGSRRAQDIPRAVAARPGYGVGADRAHAGSPQRRASARRLPRRREVLRALRLLRHVGRRPQG